MLLSSFIPILLYLIILKSLDSFKLVKWKVLCMCILSGFFCCCVAYGVSRVAGYIGLPFYAPLVEELIKAVAAVLLMRTFKMVFFVEALCYGAAIGGGFALLENFVYIVCNPYMLPATAIFRGLGTSMLHIGCTALFLTLLLQRTSKSWQQDFSRTVIRRVVDRWWILLPCFTIHGLYNYQPFSPLVQMLLIVVVFLVLFLCVNNYNEKRISRWLDNSIMSDVHLLTAIHHGTLTETNAGVYLMSVKEQFEPEIFFDMICYIQLYLELTISAKSHIMLREAGLPVDETLEERNRHCSMIREFQTLRSRIGMMGEIVLRPIVRLTLEDIKVIGG